MSNASTLMAVDLAVLRLLVGYLGEQKQFAWWDTNFLSPIGLQFMAINFPRTALSAGIHSVYDAARKIHDERIGKGSVYHLFRLPAAQEEDIHQVILSGEAFLPGEMVASKEIALSRLRERAKESAVSGSGPLLAGRICEFQDAGALGRLAFIYHQAFTNSLPCFPYYTNE